MARNSSRPIASGESWRAWVAKWLEEVPDSDSDTLIKLHPICPEKDLPVYGIKETFISEELLTFWLKSRRAVKVLTGLPSHESHDEVSGDRFDQEFELLDNVLVLPISNRRFIEPLGFEAVDYDHRFRALLTDLWCAYEEDEEWKVIGDVGGEEIYRDSTIFMRGE